MDKKLHSDFNVEKCKDSELYKISLSILKSEKLQDNTMFSKLVKRLDSFYVTAQKFRACGPTP